MEFGAGHLASADNVNEPNPDPTSECVFDDGEIITEVRADTISAGDWVFPARLTFITSEQTCVLGPQATGKTQIFRGERLLYVKGRLGCLFDVLIFVFPPC